MSIGFLETIARAGYLEALAISPRWLAPEPVAPPSPLLVAAGGAALVLPVALGAFLRRRVATIEATAAAVAWPATAIAAIVAARVWSGADAPLLRGYYVAAPFVWLSIALTFATVAGRYLGSAFKNRRLMAAVIPLAAGLLIFRSAYVLIASPWAMWRRELVFDPGNERAIDATMPDPRAAPADIAAQKKALELCIAKTPSSCTCLTRRAAASLVAKDGTSAARDAETAKLARCPLDEGSVRFREVAAYAFAMASQTSEAEAMLDGAADRGTNPYLAYADALVHDQRGDQPTAEVLARQAAGLGAGRDALLLEASLFMRRGANDDAAPVLQALHTSYPNDADVAYDIALLADLRHDYNTAREGYLEALRDDPSKRDARYNLALLTLRSGFVAEARHHAERFASSYPDDPRGKDLIKLTGANDASQPSAP